MTYLLVSGISKIPAIRRHFRRIIEIPGIRRYSQQTRLQTPSNFSIRRSNLRREGREPSNFPEFPFLRSKQLLECAKCSNDPRNVSVFISKSHVHRNYIRQYRLETKRNFKIGLLIFFFSKNLTSLARIPEIVRSYFARTINRFNIITIFSLDERENPRYNCNER